MPEPHDPRGEVPDTGVADASPGSLSDSRLPAGSADEGRTDEASERAEEPQWPVQDPEAPVGQSEQKETRETSETPEAASVAERTRRIGRPEPMQPKEPRHRDNADQDTDRITRGRGHGASAAGPAPDPVSDAANVERSTMAFGPVSPPMPAPGEEPTRQFLRPDFSGPSPEQQRAAQPADFTGAAESRQDPHVRPPQPWPEQSVPGTGAREPDPPVADPPGEWDVSVPDASEQDAHSSPGAATSIPAVPLYRRRRVLVAVSFAAVVLLAAGLVFGRSVLFGEGDTSRAEPPSPVQLRPAIKPLGGSGATLSKQQVAAALEPAVSDPALGTFGGVVLDPATGRTLWKHSAQQAFVPASTAKLLTTSAALLALDHRYRFTTKVVRGSEPGSVVLIGGGDPTLSSLPEDSSSVYPGAAHLGTLVAEVKKATGGKVSSITVDTSRYTGPGLAPGWLSADVDNGYVAPIEPVMLDGGRADPTRGVSPRSHQPALDAGRELARRLGVSTSNVDTGEAPKGARVLGEVTSASLQQMVRTVLQHSDNVLAEALAREVAIVTGHKPSFAGAAAAVRAVLTRNGFDLTGTRMVDGSGLSVEDRVTPRALGSLLLAASASRGSDGALSTRTAKLRPLLPALPVAGGNGSLEGRYQKAASNGQGWVRAKTGTLSNVNSLAGTVVTRDGHLLVFAVLSNGTASGIARPALDKVAAALRTCGCRA